MDQILFSTVSKSRSNSFRQFIKTRQNLTVYYPFNETSGTVGFNQAPTTIGTLNASIAGVTLNQPGLNGPSVYNNAFDRDGISCGDICKFTDDVTIFCFSKIVSTTVGGGSYGNFPSLAGKGGNLGYFLIFNPSMQLAFNLATSGGEKSSGSTTTSMVVGKWYLSVGRYDKDGGANNLKIDVFGNGLHESNSSTQTLAINNNSSALGFGYDANRNYNIDTLLQHCGVFNRSITDAEVLRLAKLSGIF